MKYLILYSMAYYFEICYAREWPKSLLYQNKYKCGSKCNCICTCNNHLYVKNEYLMAIPMILSAIFMIYGTETHSIWKNNESLRFMLIHRRSKKSIKPKTKS